MATAVEYLVSLKDMISGKLKQIEHNAEHLEKKMGSMTERTGELLTGLGIGFAAFKGFEMIEQGAEAFHHLHEAETRVATTMQNMGTYSEESFEGMSNAAKTMSQSIKFTQADIMGVQNQLIAARVTGEENINRITKLAADAATFTGGSIEDMGKTIAKVYNNPELAARFAAQLKLDPTVSKSIHELAKEGKTAEAQTLLLAAAEAKVQGQSENMAKTDPLFKYNKAMEQVTLTVGEAATQLKVFLAPALEWFGKMVTNTIAGVKNLVQWFKEHRAITIILGVAVGTVTAAFLVYEGVVNAAAFATKLMTAAQAMLNFVMNMNPIAIVITALAAFGTAIYLLWTKCVGFRAVLTGLWDVVKEFGSIVSDVFQGVWKQIHGVFTFNASEIKAGFGQATSAMMDAGQRMAKAYKEGYDGVIKEDARQKKAETAPAMAGAKVAPKLGAPPPDKPGKDTSPKGATGTKSTTINIHIGKLIEQFKISTTNLTETSHKIKEAVAQTMTGAIADSQIVAGI